MENGGSMDKECVGEKQAEMIRQLLHQKKTITYSENYCHDQRSSCAGWKPFCGLESRRSIAYCGLFDDVL